MLYKYVNLKRIKYENVIICIFLKIEHFFYLLVNESKVIEIVTTIYWPDGRVVMQRPAKPRTAVRFRFGPPYLLDIMI